MALVFKLYIFAFLNLKIESYFLDMILLPFIFPLHVSATELHYPQSMDFCNISNLFKLDIETTVWLYR